MSVSSRLCAALSSLVLVAGSAVGASAAPADPASYERVLNGGFTAVKTPWWSSGNTPSRVDGTINPWQSMIGQNDVPLEANQPYTLRFTASATRDVTIRATVALAVAPNTVVLNRPTALTGTPQTFAFTTYLPWSPASYQPPLTSLV
jgi:endoglucanase